MKTVALSILLLALAGCQMRADVQTTVKWMHCKDTRDGEEWTFDTATVRNPWIDPINGIAGATVTDTTGRVRTGDSRENAYVKCRPLTDSKI